MFSRSGLLKTILFGCILLMTVSATSATAPNDPSQPSTVGAIHTYLMPDLSLKSVFSSALVPLPAGGAHRKTCRCSCGTAFCATDADCGGGVGSCSAFISCCAKPEAQGFLGAAEASRRNEPVVQNITCK